MRVLSLIVRVLGAFFRNLSKPSPKAIPAETKSTEVAKNQRQLLQLGYEVQGGADGHLGKKTLDAVAEFQDDHGVKEDGLGPKTQKKLEKEHLIKVPANLAIALGDKGEMVQSFQSKIMSLGFGLPRFGADGSFGQECLVATQAFQDSFIEDTKGESAFQDQGVGPKTFQAVMDKPLSFAVKKEDTEPAASVGPLIQNMIVTKDDHPLKKGRGTRSLKNIRGVTLHQTACVLGENPRRWHNVGCHVGITRNGKIIFNNDLEKIVWHGNGFNKYTVGIEIDGHFAGLEEQKEDGSWVPDMNSYWRPAGSTRKPISITDAQVQACKEVVRWVKKIVEDAGGECKYLLAHRQSSPSRTSDPGQKTWRLVALPLLEELNMSDGGDDYYILSKGRCGKPIPEAWDPQRHAGVSYKRPKTSVKGRKSYGP